MKSAWTKSGWSAAYGFLGVAVLSTAAVLISKVPLLRDVRSAGHTYRLPLSADVTRVELPDGRTFTLDGALGEARVSDGASQKSLALPEHRHFASATLMPSGQVLVWGGVDDRGRLLDSSLWFEPAVNHFLRAGDIGLPARAGQNVTVLTDGMVLVSGGWDAAGPDTTPLLWDPQHRTSTPLSEHFDQPRMHGRAELQADGAVLVSGGLDALGNPISKSWRFSENKPAFLGQMPGATTGVAATRPLADTTEASIHGPLAIRFSEPVNTQQLASGTVTLLGPDGEVPTRVVGVDNGRLAFVQLPDDLYPGSRYTLFIKGLHKRNGDALPFNAVGFTTERVQSSGVIVAGAGQRPSATSPAAGHSEPPLYIAAGNGSEVCKDPAHLCRQKSFIRDGAWYPGADNLPDSTGAHWRLYHGRQSIPDTSREEAALGKGATAIVGQVRQIDETPVAGVEVSLGPARAKTDARGVFVLTDVPAGRHEMFVDGRTASHGDVKYGRFLVGADVQPKRIVRMPYVMYLPRILPRDEISLPAPTDRETVLTHPDMPGLEMHIPAGTVFKDREGHVLTHIAVVPTPVDNAPFPLPDNFPTYFTIQPGDAVVQGLTPEAAKGIRVVYPNYGHAKANTQGDFWVYNVKEGWQMYGAGHVSNDAKHLAPDPGVSLVWALGAGASFNNSSPPGGGRCGDPEDAEPVNLRTGALVERKVDFSIHDAMPLALMRAYRSDDSASHDFGAGSSTNFGIHLYSSDGTFQHPQLVMPCGEGITYDLVSGAATWPFPAGTIWEHTASSSTFYGSTLQFLYDTTADGAHWILTLKDGSEYAFTRHIPNSLVWMQDRFGNRTQISYNGGLLSQVVSPSGRYLDFSYDSGNRISHVTDNAGRTLSYAYNPSGSLATVTFPDQTTEKYTYDANKRLVTIENRRGIVEVTNHYNADGRVDTQTYPDNTAYQFAYTKDANGAVTMDTVTDPAGHVARYVFDPVSLYPASITRGYGTSIAQTTTYTRDSSGLVTSEVDPLGRRTDYEYDVFGNVTTLTRLAGTPNAVKYHYTYTDDYNQTASITDPLGHTTSYGYTQGCLTSVIDPLGHRTSITCNGAGQPTSVIDALGHTTSLQYQGYDLHSVTDALNRTTSFEVDDLGRRTATKDPKGNVSLVQYDSNDRVVKATDGLNLSTQTAYDGDGNVLRVTLPDGNVIHYAYDDRDRLSQRTDALGQSESWTHDGLGNVTSATDRKGQTTLYSYDVLNRRSLVSYADGGGIQATYDAANRLTELLDTQTGSLSWRYDDFSRITSAVSPEGTIVYAYDAEGRRKTMTPVAQAEVSYAYDAANRLVSMTQGNESVELAYDDSNRRTQLTLPNGVTTAYSYDALGDLTGLSYTKRDGTYLGTKTYSYDKGSQRIAEAGTLSSSDLPAFTTALSAFDVNNRQSSINGATLSYDANGDLISDGVNTYIWNARHQLVQVKQGNAVRATYVYDALGRRSVTRFGSDEPTHYLYDGSNVVQETRSGVVNPILSGLGIDERYARNDVTGRTYFLSDELGSTTALTDASGAILQRYSYDPYGNATVSDRTTGFTNPYQYTGREADIIGLDYYRARYYSPVLGRFISEDPIGFSSGQANFYAYVGDSPLGGADPSGLQAEAAVTAPSAAPVPAPAPIQPPGTGAVPDFGPPANDPAFGPEEPGLNPIELCAANPIVCGAVLLMIPETAGGPEDELPGKVIPFPGKEKPFRLQCPGNDKKPDHEENCAELRESTKRDCAGIRDRKTRSRCYAAAELNYLECLSEE